MNAPLPEVLYVQDDGRELLINRTPVGAMGRDLGYWRRAGESVGVYRLEKMVSLSPAAAAIDVTPVVVPVESQQT